MNTEFEPHRETVSPGAVTPGKIGTRYRARVEDSDGDRWSVVGTLGFLDWHCADKRLRILYVKPYTGV